ncbi:MAG: galactosyldiacylglycerol synthase [Candidatus Atribacteria bacterium]|nr:galactosyldiacylglycerol synthase [Candidatus Atribacteria bacterium]
MTNLPDHFRKDGQLPVPTKKPHILFLFSDTGGGHRAAVDAIIEALQLEFGDAATTEMVDFLKDYAPPPYNQLPRFYPEMVRLPELWGVGYKISDGRPQARLMTSTFWPYVRRAARRLVKEHPADLLVSVHPLANSFFLRALGKNRPPFVTVVTDMVSTHALWFDKRADLILVPTRMARDSALENHMSPEKVRVAGQPISERHCQAGCDKPSLREIFGWPADKFTVLLVGGGDGMGPLAETARAIDESGLDVNLVIVAGRNTKLKDYLETLPWENPTYIYGFTHEMPNFMRAADAIVTKAGPGTIAEALVAGLPVIIYSKLPGQEDGNVTYVENSGVGVWAPDPLKVVRTLTHWVCRPAERTKVTENCRSAARPDAARVIARALGEKIGLTK